MSVMRHLPQINAMTIVAMWPVCDIQWCSYCYCYEQPDSWLLNWIAGVVSILICVMTYSCVVVVFMCSCVASQPVRWCCCGMQTCVFCIPLYILHCYSLIHCTFILVVILLMILMTDLFDSILILIQYSDDIIDIWLYFIIHYYSFIVDDYFIVLSSGPICVLLIWMTVYYYYFNDIHFDYCIDIVLISIVVLFYWYC